MSEQQQPQMPTPNPKLKALEPMVGHWKMSGRTVGAQEDNVKGEAHIEWLPGGFFLKQTVDIEFAGMFRVQGTEIVGYDMQKDKLTSLVYSNMAPMAIPYTWDLEGRNLTIEMPPSAIMHGKIGEDGDTFTTSWRATEGHENDPGVMAYDLTGTRIK